MKKADISKAIPWSRQEEAYNFVTETFLKLLENDKRISYDFKKSVMAFWEDLFAHKGVRNNMIQAFSNFLWELDNKMDSARKAGIVQAKDAVRMALEAMPSNDDDNLPSILNAIDDLLNAENTPEEAPLTEAEVKSLDLSEVGGGDEDDTPLL